MGLNMVYSPQVIIPFEGESTMPYKNKEAQLAQRKRYYADNKELVKARAKAHYEDNKKHHRELNKLWCAEHYEWQLLKRAKDSSKQRGLECSITIEDITIPEVCPYLGIKLTTISNGGRQDTNASLDRIDNTKGYTKENIQVISAKANFMKRNATIEELLNFAVGIQRVHAKTTIETIG